MQISTETLEGYLISHKILPSGSIKVTPLTGGVSALVFKVESQEGSFVVKQACEKLRVQEDWFSDPARADREYLFLQLLSPLLPKGSLPEPLWQDKENHILAMSLIEGPATPWKQELLAGNTEPGLARKAGAILASIHQAGFNHRDLCFRLVDKTLFQQLRLEPFHNRLMKRRPELVPFVQPLVETSLNSEENICHGDFSPKNLLLSPAGLTLVDHETAHLGDGAMDLGFFLCHLYLKGLRAGADQPLFHKLIRIFLAEYEALGGFRGPDFRKRARGHFAVTVLTRVEGTSPVDYLNEEQKATARDQAIISLTSKSLFPW